MNYLSKSEVVNNQYEVSCSMSTGSKQIVPAKLDKNPANQSATEQSATEVTDFILAPAHFQQQSILLRS